jgi:hypothetical protein
LREYLDQGYFYVLENNNSEEIAAYLHFFLTVTPYEISKGNTSKNSVVRKTKQRDDSLDDEGKLNNRSAREKSKERVAASNNNNSSNNTSNIQDKKAAPAKKK